MDGVGGWVEKGVRARGGEREGREGRGRERRGG